MSYAEAYQAVFQLCKKGMHENLINKIREFSQMHFFSILSNLDLEPSSHQKMFSQFKDIIEKCKDAIDRLTEVFLYVETNYFYQCKREHASIKEMLICMLYQELVENRKILNKISEIITNLHKQGQNDSIQNFLFLVHELD